MWPLLVRVVFSTGCNDGTVHWLQPNLQGMVDTGLLTPNDAHDAWCYPTAAASLLGKLANDGKWASAMEGGAKYPTASDTYASQQRTTPWMDYAWHETDALNLGHYMHTNSGGSSTGTTLANGRKGIVDFIKSVDPSKKAVVEIHDGYPGVSHTYPLLLHIDQNCIPANYDSAEEPIKLSPSGSEATILEGNPSTLGHTVVSYAAVAGEGDIAIVYDVAMNVRTHANYNGTECTATKLKLPNTPNSALSCIQNHTTVRIVENESDTFPVAAIIGIAVGGVAVVGIAGYILYTKKLTLF